MAITPFYVPDSMNEHYPFDNPESSAYASVENGALRLDTVNKIQSIKAVREMTALGLKEAKDFVDTYCKLVGQFAVKEAMDRKADTLMMEAVETLRGLYFKHIPSADFDQAHAAAVNALFKEIDDYRRGL